MDVASGIWHLGVDGKDEGELSFVHTRLVVFKIACAAQAIHSK